MSLHYNSNASFASHSMPVKLTALDCMTTRPSMISVPAECRRAKKRLKKGAENGGGGGDDKKNK